MSCELECGEVQGSKPETGSSCGWKLCGGVLGEECALEATVMYRLCRGSPALGREKQLRMRRVTRREL